MKIAIDALGIREPGGGRTATLNQLQALLRLDQENEYRIVVDQEEPSLDAPHARQVVAGKRGRLASRLWAQGVLPGLLRRERIDLVHFVKNLGSFFVPCRSVVTVYDLSVLLYPEIYPWSDRLYWRWVEPLTLRHADRVIAISQDTAHDLERFYRLERGRVEVIYPGYDESYRPLPAEQVAAIRSKYGLPDQFVLHVGSISRKKNLLPVVRAIALLRERGQDVRLVLIGRLYGKGRDGELLRGLESGELASQVTWLGAVPSEDLPALYNAATVLTFPSLQEGFGLVPLEAMACGLPVITSGAGAIGEVVGDAARIVEAAGDAEAWAQTLQEVLREPEARQTMRKAGLRQATQFSNEVSAQRLLAVYHEVMAT
ncbi:MAG: D-inositol 3-phosphate glycosyltransferase [Chloroflexi bacterium ADurb.Bin180]|nr:MAG: D-inositol 3-phosphate glycosyltransferase [Chloroflexi bacterium ADurb.Bin180]